MTSSELEVTQDWAPFLLGDQAPEFVDPEQASREIVLRILESPDVDAVFDQAGTTPCTEIIGKQIQIEGARAMKSAFESGATMYLLLDVVDLATGEKLLVTCGARNVMAQLYRIQQLDGYPVACRITKSERPTAEGYYPLWLKR